MIQAGLGEDLGGAKGGERGVTLSDWFSGPTPSIDLPSLFPSASSRQASRRGEQPTTPPAQIAALSPTHAHALLSPPCFSGGSAVANLPTTLETWVGS